MNRISGSSCLHCHPGRSEGPLNRRISILVRRTVEFSLYEASALVRFLTLLGMTTLVSVSAGTLFAQDQSATSISREVRDVFDHSAKAVVRIHGVDEHSDIYGTGFFVDPTGTLFTAYTVGGEADSFSIQFGGKEYPARQVVADLRSGIAILKIDLVTPTLPIGTSQGLEVATPVVTIGYPLDLGKTPRDRK